MNLGVVNPNLSIVVPGGCNARCEFCFWKDELYNFEYLPKLYSLLTHLSPEYFNQISITGGEPTAADRYVFLGILDSVLMMRRMGRYKKVVLTTNGYRINEYYDHLYGIIDHVNISRHAVGDNENRKIFNADTVPSIAELKVISNEINNIGIDVTLSAVIGDHLSAIDNIIDYIDFAKSVGVQQVFFRKRHGDINPTEIEKKFNHIVSTEFNCGVCRTNTQYIHGMKVVWRSSVSEPSDHMDKVYELIFHPSGKLTTDWGGKKIVNPYEIGEKYSKYCSYLVYKYSCGIGTRGC